MSDILFILAFLTDAQEIQTNEIRMIKNDILLFIPKLYL